MNAWQRLIYATAYAIATAWFDARKDTLRGIEEIPSDGDLRRASRFRAAILQSGQSGDPVRDDPAQAGKHDHG